MPVISMTQTAAQTPEQWLLTEAVAPSIKMADAPNSMTAADPRRAN